jgi:hypothetical protein
MDCYYVRVKGEVYPVVPVEMLLWKVSQPVFDGKGVHQGTWNPKTRKLMKPLFQ